MAARANVTMLSEERRTDVRDLVETLARDAKSASRALARAPTAKKNAILLRAATALRESCRAAVLEANAADVAAARAAGLSRALIDRLTIDQRRLDGVARSIEDVAKLADPVGEIVEMRRLANGLLAGRMRVPLGVIAIVYESRPNVTADAAALCIKSGNACILRGGSEAFRTSTAIAAAFAGALEAEGLPAACAALVPTTDREATLVLIGLDGLVDLAIPRGGEELIRFVVDHARVPVIKHYKGVCHVYVDGDADLEMAVRIAVNAKAQRPGVCNAMETLLVDRACADAFLPRVAGALAERGVELRADAEALRRIPSARPATAADWDTEYLDLVLAIAVVDGIDGALDHVARHGTQHTEAIVTTSYDKAQRWIREVDASLVLVNASTRFNDGSELGLGAEIGISTTKMHAYGPMGLAELCTLKWIAYGQGEVRD